MTGKGDGRLHARQQCSDEEMQANWDRIFNRSEGVAKSFKTSSELIREAKDAMDRFSVVAMNHIKDELKGNGDTFEEKVSLSDEMRLHGDKHKPEGL